VQGLFLVGAGTHPGAGIPSVVTSSEVLMQLVPDAPRPMTAPMKLSAE
jgi:phytoene desaturase